MLPSAEASSTLLDWALLVVGLVVAALCIWFGPVLAGFVPVESIWGATAFLYAFIFAPMVLIAIGFSVAAEAPSFPLGVRSLWWAGIGLLTGIGGLAVAAGYAFLAGTMTSTTGSEIGAGLVVGAVIIAFQVISEELFFRGWIQSLLKRRTGFMTAIAVTALLFTGFHILGGARSPVTLLNLLIGGIWFGLLAWRSAGLVAPIAAHLGWNISEQLLLGLDPNPGVGEFGSVGDWDLVGSELWGGSDEGLNASIAMTFVMLALIIPLVRRPSAIAPAAPVPHQRGRAAA